MNTTNSSISIIIMIFYNKIVICVSQNKKNYQNLKMSDLFGFGPFNTYTSNPCNRIAVWVKIGKKTLQTWMKRNGWKIRYLSLKIERRWSRCLVCNIKKWYCNSKGQKIMQICCVVLIYNRRKHMKWKYVVKWLIISVFCQWGIFMILEVKTMGLHASPHVFVVIMELFIKEVVSHSSVCKYEKCEITSITHMCVLMICCSLPMIILTLVMIFKSACL